MEERHVGENTRHRVELGQRGLWIPRLAQRRGTIEARRCILRIDRQYGIDLPQRVVPAVLGKRLLRQRHRTLLGRDAPMLGGERMVGLGIGELRGVADQIGRRHCGGVDVGRDGNLLRQPHTGGGERIKIEQNPVLHSPAGYASNAPSPPPFRPLHCVHHLRQQCCRIANTGRGSDICPSPALLST